MRSSAWCAPHPAPADHGGQDGAPRTVASTCATSKRRSMPDAAAPALEAGPSSTHAAAQMPQTRNLAPVAPVHCRCGQRWQKAGKPGSIAALEEWERCKADGGIKRQALQLAGYAADGQIFKRLRMPAPQRLSCWDTPASSEDTQSLDRRACSSPPSAVLQLCLCLRLHTARPRCTFLPPLCRCCPSQVPQLCCGSDRN